MGKRLIVVLSSAVLGAGFAPPVAIAVTPESTVASASASARPAEVPILLTRARHRASIQAERSSVDADTVAISVRTNAKKVTLRYRTHAGALRSTTVKVRSGRATKLLPSSTGQVHARANATSRLRVSRSIAVPAVASTWWQDLTGDGVPEFCYDANANGALELVLLDNNRNGRFEQATLLDGPIWAVALDAAEDGYFEAVGIDTDHDAVVERLFYDSNQDRVVDWVMLDTNADGRADTWSAMTPAYAATTQSRQDSDLLVRNIVTLNQLRQFDPLSTGYIPYDPTPSILR